MTSHRLSPIAAALAAALAAGGVLTAAAQSLTIVEGTVTSATATSATVTTKSGKTAVTITGRTRVTRRLPATLADIKVGSFLGVAASKAPDGALTAVSINILDAIKNVASRGQFRMESGNIMTNADVTSVVIGKAGRTIKMAYKAKAATIFVPATTPIHRIERGKLTDLKAGQRVTVRGTAGANGGVTASSITIE